MTAPADKTRLQLWFGWLRCLRHGHTYRPWCYVRIWGGRKRPALEERQYECVRCAALTPWMTGRARKAFEKEHKPSWSNR